jgi:hypothetical protein
MSPFSSSPQPDEPMYGFTEEPDFEPNNSEENKEIIQEILRLQRLFKEVSQDN